MNPLEPKHFFLQFRLNAKSHLDRLRARAIQKWKEQGTYPEHIRSAIDKEAALAPTSTEQSLLDQIATQQRLLQEVLSILRDGKQIIVQTEDGNPDESSTETLRDLSSMVNISDVFKFGA